MANEWDWGWVGQTIVTYIMTSRGRQKVYRDRLKLGVGREEPFHFPVIGSALAEGMIWTTPGVERMKAGGD